MSRFRTLVRSTYRRFLMTLPDEAALRLHYLRTQRRVLHLSSPQRFTEKIQWLKLYDRDPMKVIAADKLRARDYVRDRIGAEHLIPLLASADRPEDLDFARFGDRYIVKTNHGSGGNVAVLGRHMLVRGRLQAFDQHSIQAILTSALATDYSSVGREWEYSPIPRKIIVEELLADYAGNCLLTDYKVYCFNGRAHFIQVIADRAEGVKETWFDREWEPQPFHYFSSSTKDLPRPSRLDALLATAESLAAGFQYVRVDLYLVGERVYFGEMTFHPASGFMRFAPREWDEKLGRLLTLSNGSLAREGAVYGCQRARKLGRRRGFFYPTQTRVFRLGRAPNPRVRGDD